MDEKKLTYDLITEIWKLNKTFLEKSENGTKALMDEVFFDELVAESVIIFGKWENEQNDLGKFARGLLIETMEHFNRMGKGE